MGETMTEVAQRMAPHIEAAATTAMEAVGNFIETAAPVVSGVMQGAHCRAISEHEHRVRLAEGDLKCCTESVAKCERSVQMQEEEVSKYEASCQPGQNRLKGEIKSILFRLRNHVCIGGTGCGIIFLVWQARHWWIFRLLLIPLVPIQALLMVDCGLICRHLISACDALFKRTSHDKSNGEVFQERLTEARRSLQL